jgi:hypothetical protein
MHCVVDPAAYNGWKDSHRKSFKSIASGSIDCDVVAPPLLACRVGGPPSKSPRAIELTLPPTPDDIAPTTYLGIYRLEGDDLTICLSPPNKKRPSEFKTQEKTHQLLLKLKRALATGWQELPPRTLLHRQPGDDASAKPAVKSEAIPVPR